MVFWRKNKKDSTARASTGDRPAPSDLTVLGPGWQLKGRVYGKGQVVIRSVFEGELDIQGRMTVDTPAKVKGSFRAEDFRICGTLDGAVDASRMVVLETTARFDGKLNTPRLQMEAGAQLNAEITMENQGASLQGLRR